MNVPQVFKIHDRAATFILHPSTFILSNKLQIEFRSDLANQLSGHVMDWPIAIPLQIRMGGNVDAEELESSKNHGIAAAPHRAVVDLEGDADGDIIGEPEASGQ